MSSTDSTRAIEEFLGVPLPRAKGSRLHLHGLRLDEIRQIALDALRRGLNVKTHNNGATRWLTISRERDDLVVFVDSRASAADFLSIGQLVEEFGEISPSAEVQFQQECDDSLASASIVAVGLLDREIADMQVEG